MVSSSLAITLLSKSSVLLSPLSSHKNHKQIPYFHYLDNAWISLLLSAVCLFDLVTWPILHTHVETCAEMKKTRIILPCPGFFSLVLLNNMDYALRVPGASFTQNAQLKGHWKSVHESSVNNKLQALWNTSVASFLHELIPCVFPSQVSL